MSGSLQWCFEPQWAEGVSGTPRASLAFDGGVVVAGRRQPADSNDYLGWLIALDSAGDSITRDEGGGYVVVGLSKPDAWVAALDESSKLVWERRFNYEGGPDSASGVALLDNGDVAVVGSATTTKLNSIDQPLRMGFQRVFHGSGGVTQDVTLVGPQEPGPSQAFAEVAPWAGDTLIGGFETPDLPLSSTAKLWRVDSSDQLTQMWTAPDEPLATSIYTIAVRPGAGVLVAGARTDRINEDEVRLQQWLVRLERDLSTTAWEHIGSSPAQAISAIAPAVDELAIYTAATVYPDEGGMFSWAGWLAWRC